ncbi:MAG: hypothetical protein ACT4OJ_02540 [Bacteroidota bacterium]
MSKGMAIFVFSLLSATGITAQPVDYNAAPVQKNKTVKGWLYGSFGWHRIYFTNSTIHFRNNKSQQYDFRLIRAKAVDDNDLNIGEGIDAPQWSLRFGFLFNSKGGWGIEWSYDHAKYVLKQGQRVRLRGNISGQQYDTDSILHPSFIEYEHTDGANYYMLNLVRRNNLFTSKKNRHTDLLLKAGAGIVIPRTESRIMGGYYNEHYHISGWLAGAEGSLRQELLKNIFAELSLKGVYADYSDVLLWGGGRASQHWWSFQYLMTVTYQFAVKKKN